MKRTPLRQGRRRPVASRAVREPWYDRVRRSGCVVCGAQAQDGHHAIPAQQLRRRGLHDHVWDARNCVPLCRDDHDRHEVAFRRVRPEELPVSVWEFAAELDLTWLVERIYGRRSNDLESKRTASESCIP